MWLLCNASTPGITVIDPLLTLAADGPLRPATNSPAVDAAAGSYPAVSMDLDGEPRTAGLKDAGADEVFATPPAWLPVARDGVGPRWMRPSSPQITDVLVTLSDAEVIFGDLTGLAPVYSLERRVSLVTGSWVVVTNLVPAAYTNTRFRMADPSPVPDPVFWRIKATSPP